MSKLAVDLPSTRPGWHAKSLAPMLGRPAQALDLFALGVAFVVVRFWQDSQAGHALSPSAFLGPLVSLRNGLVALLCLATWRMLLLSVGLYSRSRSRSMADYLVRWVIGLNTCAAVVGLVEVVLHRADALWRGLEVFWVVALAGMVLTRATLLVSAGVPVPAMRGVRRLVIVGSGERAAQMVRELQEHAEWQYALVGVVSAEPLGPRTPPALLLGGPDDLERILMRTAVDEVVIALPLKTHHEVVEEAIATCQRLGIPSQYFSDYFRRETPKPSRT